MEFNILRVYMGRILLLTSAITAFTKNVMYLGTSFLYAPLSLALSTDRGRKCADEPRLESTA